MNKEIGKNVFRFHFKSSDSTGLFFTSKLILDNEQSLYWNHEIQLNSFGNSVTMNITDSHITPQTLRQLADQLEAIETGVKDGAAHAEDGA